MQRCKMTTIQKKLFELSDEKYAAFQKKLTPTIDEKNIIGVRVPILRNLAKELVKDESVDIAGFLNTLPHKYYDENMLHGLILSEYKNYDECIKLVNEFLPFVDNWAVCDIMSPKIFKKNKNELLRQIKLWVKSDEEYTIRFGIEMLMSHYLDDDFKEEYLKIPMSVKSEAYYVQMMVAWFYATALAKHWDETVPYIENRKMPEFEHKKTIQKAKESFRITEEQKKYLNSFL